MRAVVWQGPSEMSIEERPEPPDPQPGEVIVQPQAVGICGSEIEGYLGHMGNRVPPLIMGHEFAGRVIAAGDEDSDLQDARVAVNPLSGCGECRLCRAGLTNLCKDRKLIGVHSDGAFADYVRAPAASARRLPDDVPARLGAMAEPLANGVHAVGLGLASDQPVEHAIVLGAGTIGIVTLQAALLAGIEHVAVLEPQPQRRALAHRLGAHSVYAAPDDAERDADLVIDAVGAEATRSLGVELLRPGGRLVCIGLAADATTLPFHTVVRNQLAIQGSYAYTMGDYETALDHLVSGRASLGELPDVLPLDAGPEAFARLAGGPPPDQIKTFLAGDGREG